MSSQSRKNDQTTLPEHGALIEAVSRVYDPEIPVNIYDLGLIYRLELKPGGIVEVDMTLTAPGCPVAGSLPGEVGRVIESVVGVSEAVVKLVWDPPWSQDRISEAARLQLGLL